MKTFSRQLKLKMNFYEQQERRLKLMVLIETIIIVVNCLLMSNVFFAGFHDAIGDAISLSITPKHLQSLGLIQKSIDDTAHDINFLFSLAMDKVSKTI
jgi:Angiotensin-converting enzyme